MAQQHHRAAVLHSVVVGMMVLECVPKVTRGKQAAGDRFRAHRARFEMVLGEKPEGYEFIANSE